MAAGDGFERESTPHQFALELFHSHIPDRLPITAASQEIGYWRSDVFLDITTLSLKESRCFDTLCYLVSDCAEMREIYDVDLPFFMWLINSEGNNFGEVKKALLGLKKASATGEMFPGTPFEKSGYAVIFPKAVIDRSRVLFSCDPDAQRMLKRPEAAKHFLSLRIANGFSSVYARRLYVRLKRLLDNGVGLIRVDIDDFRLEWLGAKGKVYENWTNFRRNVLAPCEDGINGGDTRADSKGFCCDIEFEWRGISLPGSKAIKIIELRVRHKEGWTSGKTSVAYLAKLYKTLKYDFGLSAANLEEIRNNRKEFTDEVIEGAMAYTLNRLRKAAEKVATPVNDITALFMYAVRNQMRVAGLELNGGRLMLDNNSSPVAQPAALSPPVEQLDQAHNTKRDAAIAQSWAAFDAMPATEQLDALNRFMQSPTFKLAVKDAPKTASLDLLPELRANPVFVIGFGSFLKAAKLPGVA